jgi:hypothetical protein
MLFFWPFFFLQLALSLEVDEFKIRMKSRRLGITLELKDWIHNLNQTLKFLKNLEKVKDLRDH